MKANRHLKIGFTVWIVLSLGIGLFWIIGLGLMMLFMALCFGIGIWYDRDFREFKPRYKVTVAELHADGRTVWHRRTVESSEIDNAIYYVNIDKNQRFELSVDEKNHYE